MSVQRSLEKYSALVARGEEIAANSGEDLYEKLLMWSFYGSNSDIRPHQIPMRDLGYAIISSSEFDSTLVVSGTGTGKSITVFSSILRLLATRGDSKRFIVIACPTQALAIEMELSIRDSLWKIEYSRHHGSTDVKNRFPPSGFVQTQSRGCSGVVHPLSKVVVGSGEVPSPVISTGMAKHYAAVVVCTYEHALSLVHRHDEQLSDGVSYISCLSGIIIDEAHYISNSSRDSAAALMTWVTAFGIRCIGMTGTTTDSLNSLFVNVLHPSYARAKYIADVTSDIVIDMRNSNPVADMVVKLNNSCIRMGRRQLVFIQNKGFIRLLAGELLSLRGEYGCESSSRLHRLKYPVPQRRSGNVSRESLFLAAVSIDNIIRADRSVIYSEGYDDNLVEYTFSDALIELYKDYGVVVVTGDMSPYTRKALSKVLTHSSAGWTTCICTSALAEGVNPSNVFAVFIPGVSKTPAMVLNRIQIRQMCGRVDREVRGGFVIRPRNDMLSMPEDQSHGIGYITRCIGDSISLEDMNTLRGHLLGTIPCDECLIADPSVDSMRISLGRNDDIIGEYGVTTILSGVTTLFENKLNMIGLYTLSDGVFRIDTIASVLLQNTARVTTWGQDRKRVTREDIRPCAFFMSSKMISMLDRVPPFVVFACIMLTLKWSGAGGERAGKYITEIESVCTRAENSRVGEVSGVYSSIEEYVNEFCNICCSSSAYEMMDKPMYGCMVVKRMPSSFGDFMRSFFTPFLCTAVSLKGCITSLAESYSIGIPHMRSIVHDTVSLATQFSKLDIESLQYSSIQKYSIFLRTTGEVNAEHLSTLYDETLESSIRTQILYHRSNGFNGVPCSTEFRQFNTRRTPGMMERVASTMYSDAVKALGKPYIPVTPYILHKLGSSMISVVCGDKRMSKGWGRWRNVLMTHDSKNGITRSMLNGTILVKEVCDDVVSGEVCTPVAAPLMHFCDIIDGTTTVLVSSKWADVPGDLAPGIPEECVIKTSD